MMIVVKIKSVARPEASTQENITIRFAEIPPKKYLQSSFNQFLKDLSSETCFLRTKYPN